MANRYTLTKHYQTGDKIASYSNNFYCREFLYNNYLSSLGLANNFVGITIVDNYYRTAPLSEITLSKMGYFFKRYLFKNETLEIFSDGNIRVIFVDDKQPSAPLISLAYLLRCYFLRWFNRKTDLNYMLNKVLYSSISRLSYDWSVQLGTTFYLWYIGTQLETTDYTPSTDKLVTSSNGPGHYGAYLLTGYKPWNSDTKIEPIDSNIVRQFIDENYTMLDKFIGRRFKGLKSYGNCINYGLFIDAYKDKYDQPTKKVELNW